MYVPAKYTYLTLSSAVYWSTLILVVSSPDSSHRMLLPGTVPWLWEPHWEQLGSWLCSCSVGEHCHQTLAQPLAEQLNTSADTFQKVAFERIFASTKPFLVLSSVCDNGQLSLSKGMPQETWLLTFSSKTIGMVWRCSKCIPILNFETNWIFSRVFLHIPCSVFYVFAQYLLCSLVSLPPALNMEYQRTQYLGMATEILNLP